MHSGVKLQHYNKETQMYHLNQDEMGLVMFALDQEYFHLDDLVRTMNLQKYLAGSVESTALVKFKKMQDDIQILMRKMEAHGRKGEAATEGEILCTQEGV